jgi:signal transduction histidine kinase
MTRPRAVRTRTALDKPEVSRQKSARIDADGQAQKPGRSASRRRITSRGSLEERNLAQMIEEAEKVLLRMGHDLKGRLQVVWGQVDLLCNGSQGSLTARQTLMLDQIQSGSSALLEIIEGGLHRLHTLLPGRVPSP